MSEEEPVLTVLGTGAQFLAALEVEKAVASAPEADVVAPEKATEVAEDAEELAPTA